MRELVALPHSCLLFGQQVQLYKLYLVLLVEHREERERERELQQVLLLQPLQMQSKFNYCKFYSVHEVKLNFSSIFILKYKIRIKFLCVGFGDGVVL